jgi:hypothetical protein
MMVREMACEIIANRSQFATTEIARAAGFPNIRAMRETFHARAKVRLAGPQLNCA